tara:strand:+ start:382 stop:522 length:141 start_codon:yes stop_codon:yes gene_type:complete
MDKKEFEKLLKSKLKKQGVSEEWIEKHMIFDTFNGINYCKAGEKND